MQQQQSAAAAAERERERETESLSPSAAAVALVKGQFSNHREANLLVQGGGDSEAYLLGMPVPRNNRLSADLSVVEDLLGSNNPTQQTRLRICYAALVRVRIEKERHLQQQQQQQQQQQRGTL